MDATNLYGPSISEPLPYDGIIFEMNICLKEILNTPEHNEIGFFIF